MAEDFTTCRDRECASLFPLKKVPSGSDLNAAGYIQTAHLDVRTRDGNFGHLKVYQKPRAAQRIVTSSIRMEGSGQRGTENLAWGTVECGFPIPSGAVPQPKWRASDDEEETSPQKERRAPSPLLAVDMDEDDETIWTETSIQEQP